MSFIEKVIVFIEYFLSKFCFVLRILNCVYSKPHCLSYFFVAHRYQNCRRFLWRRNIRTTSYGLKRVAPDAHSPPFAVFSIRCSSSAFVFTYVYDDLDGHRTKYPPMFPPGRGISNPPWCTRDPGRQTHYSSLYLLSSAKRSSTTLNTLPLLPSHTIPRCRSIRGWR